MGLLGGLDARLLAGARRLRDHLALLDGDVHRGALVGRGGLDELGGRAGLLGGLVGAGLEVALALLGRVNAQGLARLEGQVVQCEATEHVVHQRLGHPHVGVVGETGRLEAQVGELRDVGLQRHAVLQADADRDRERVHHAGQGRALLAELEEDLAQLAVVVGTGGHVALGATHGEGGGARDARLRQALAGRGVDDLLHDLLDDLGRGLSRVGCILLGLGATVGERLAHLASVAVHSGRLQTELPGLEVDVLDLLDRGALGEVDGLGDGTGEERLGRRHHPHVAHRLESTHTHGGVEDLVVLGLQARSVDDVTVLGDVVDDRLDLLGLVAELLQRPRDGLVDDLHRAAADELLELHQGEVGLDAGGVAVHHEADGAGGREHRGLRVAEAVGLTQRDHVGPRGRRQLVGRGVVDVQSAHRVVGGLVLAHDPLVGLGVAGVPVVGADHAGQLGRALVGGPGHQRGDGRGHRTATLGVVAQAHGHQQGAEVGVADAELAVVDGGLTDRLGREVGEADGDVHRGDDELHRLREQLGVEGVVVLEELQQVQRSEVARGVVQRHVLRARVGRGDPPGLGVGVPVVDRVVVLQARVGALPRGGGDLAPQVAGVDGLDDLAGLAGAQTEVGALLDRAHELVADAHGVVGVLVLDRRDVVAAEVHVEPGVAQDADLVLLARLGLHELLDVGVVDVEDDHLRRATRGATGLDGARGGVGTAHEGDRARGGATGGEELLGGADPGEVEAGTGAALEDEALLLVPVQDRVHRVVDGEDEAGRDLLRARGAHVEPDRGVEGEVLVDQQPGQLVLEELGVGVGGEVAVVDAGLGVGLHHAVDELLEAPLPRLAAHRTAEVLGRDDGRGVDRPGGGELHALLLEDGLAGLPVGLDDVAALPGQLVVGVGALGAEDALDGEARSGLRLRSCAAHRLGHGGAPLFPV